MIGAMFEANIKYKRLNEILRDDVYYRTAYASKVNVIIDLKSIFRKAYRMKDLDVPTMNAIEDISSDVINLIGFYRNYFYKMYRNSCFYLLYSEKECDQFIQDYPDYKKDYYSKYFHSTDRDVINKIIASALKRIKSVVKYIPKAYYLDTSKLDEFIYSDVLISDLSGKNEISVILTDDAMLYQSLGSNCVAIDIKGMNSKLIDNKSAMSYLCEKETSLSNSLLPLFLSITGMERYSIEGIKNFGFKKALKSISELVNSGVLIDTRYMVFPKAELLKSDNRFITDNISLIEKNYGIILPIELEMKNSVIIRSEIEAQMQKPVVTKKEFQDLNNRIFLNYPINVNEILETV